MIFSTETINTLYESVSGTEGGSPTVFTIDITNPLVLGDFVIIDDVVFNFVETPSKDNEVAIGNTAIQSATALLKVLEASDNGTVSDFEYSRDGSVISAVCRHNGDSFNGINIEQSTPDTHASSLIKVDDAEVDDTLVIGGITFTLQDGSIAANDVVIGDNDDETINNLYEVLENYESLKEDYTFTMLDGDISIVSNIVGPSGNAEITSTGGIITEDLTGGTVGDRIELVRPSGGADDAIRSPIVGTDENGETKDFDKAVVCLISLVEATLRTQTDDPSENETIARQVRLNRNRLKRLLTELSMFVSASVEPDTDDRDRVADMFIDRITKRLSTQIKYT